MKKNKNGDLRIKIIVTIIGVIVLLTMALFYYKFFVYDKRTVYSNKGISLSYKVININSNSKENDNCLIVTKSLDGSLTFKENEVPIIGFMDYNTKIIDKEVKVTLYSIKDSDEYSKLAALKSIKTNDMKVFDNIKTKIIKNSEENRSAYFDFGRKLNKGYYLAKYNIDGYCKDFYQLIQISNITSYVGNTERDILVWTMNPVNDSPIKDAKVYLGDKKVTTNSDGIAKLENLINESETKIKYIKINNNDDELLVAINDFNTENYYKGFIYTDRPLYKKTDVIKVWGFVPLKLFTDGVKNEFMVKFRDKNYEVKPNEDGMFTLEINVKNYTEEADDYVKLYYKESEIALAPISIQEYVKPTVEYKIDTNKNNYSVGDVITVSVRASYLTGEPYTGKTLYVGFNKKTYECVLTTEGKCILVIDTAKYKPDAYMAEYNIINDAFYLSEDELFNVENYNVYDDLKEGSLLASTRISFLNRDIKLNVERKMIANDKYNFILNVEKITIENDKFVYKKVNKNVDIKVTKMTCKGSNVEYTKYNPNTKKEEKYYLYNNDCDLDSKNEVAKSYDVYIVNGKKEFSDLNYLSKLQKDDKYILVENYNLKFTTKDSKNNEIITNTSVPWATIDNYYLAEGTSSLGLTSFDPFCSGESCEVYPILNYKNLDDIYSTDNKIDTRLYSNDVTEKTNGTKLTYLFKDKIINTFFNKSDITFTKDYFPGVDIGGAFYNKDIKNINLVNRNYLDYRETDRKVDISLTTDNTLYEPNGNVTLDIKATDKDGKAVETNILISVVDEAIFLIRDDRNKEISTIYDDKDFKFYQYSTYLELPFVSGGGGTIDSELGIAKVSDTIFFKNIKTDKNGIAKVTFKLNSLETKFRITAIAVNPDLYYGTNSMNIISKTKVVEEELIVEDNNEEQPTT